MIEVSKFNLDSPQLEAQMEALVGPPGQWQARRNVQLALLDKFCLSQKTKFLDLGCGSLRLGLPLINHLAVGHYTGIDVNADCIAAAHKLIDHFNLRDRLPNIIQSQNFGFDELNDKAKFDMIWIFQVFVHLTDEFVQQAMKAISALLAEDGTAYGTLRLNNQSETLTLRGNWRNYPVVHGPLSYYQTCAAENGLILETLGSIDKNGLTKSYRPVIVVKMTHG